MKLPIYLICSCTNFTLCLQNTFGITEKQSTLPFFCASSVLDSGLCVVQKGAVRLQAELHRLTNRFNSSAVMLH